MPAFMHLPADPQREEDQNLQAERGLRHCHEATRGVIFPQRSLITWYYLGLKRGNDAEQTDTGIFFDLPRMVADVGLFLRVDGSSTCRS